MKDIIDKRNEEERYRKSIIKYWNVNYLPQEGDGKMDGEAEGILGSLKAEAESKDAKMRDEIEKLREETELKDKGMYNAATGSYSGAYGQGEVSEVTKGQIDQILREKKDIVKDLVAREMGG